MIADMITNGGRLSTGAGVGFTTLPFTTAFDVNPNVGSTALFALRIVYL